MNMFAECMTTIAEAAIEYYEGDGLVFPPEDYDYNVHMYFEEAVHRFFLAQYPLDSGYALLLGRGL